MQMTLSDFENTWYVRQSAMTASPVTSVIFYQNNPVKGEEGFVLLDTERAWLPPQTPWASNAIKSVESFGEIRNRNKVNFNRLEHFFVKGLLFINVALLNGYGNVETETATDEHGTQTMKRQTLQVRLAYDGQEEQWYKATERSYSHHENTPFGDMVEEFMTVYNANVPDHINRNISKWQAVRLIKTMPMLNRIVTEYETN